MSAIYIDGVTASGSGTSLNLPAYSPVGQNLLVLVVGILALNDGFAEASQISMPAITDSAGNKWNTVGATPCSRAVYGTGFASSWQLFAFYVRKSLIKAAIINVALPGDQCNIAMALAEYSGLDKNLPLDVFQVNEAENGSLAMSVDTGEIVTTQGFEVLFSAAFDDANGDGTAQTFTPSAGFTTRQVLTDAPNSLNLAIFDKNVSVNGTYSNTISATSLSDGLHALIIGFSQTPVSSPVVQCASSFGTPDGTHQSVAVAPFSLPNTANNSIILITFGDTGSPSDSLGNDYIPLINFGPFFVWMVAKCLAGPNIVTVPRITGIGASQSGIVALETFPAIYTSSNDGVVTPGVRANTGLVFANVGDLLLLLGAAYDSGLDSTQQQRGDPGYSMLSQHSGLGDEDSVDWAGSAFWLKAPITSDFGAGIEVDLAVTLAAGLIGFSITYPSPVAVRTNSLLRFDTNYNRWGNQSYNVETIFYEADTNLLLFATPETDGYAIRKVVFQDYEDGGYAAGQLTQVAIPVDIQIPYQDLGKPHFPKQWNMVELDVDTKGQDLTVILNFDDDVAPITIGTVNTSSRQKVQLPVNAGDGQESYKCSPELRMNVLTAPTIYQINIYAAVLAANRNTFDTYWIGFDSNEFKIGKEGYFDYTSAANITVQLFADGRPGAYYTFTLPANPTRLQVPERVRFPAMKFRLWRLVMTSTAAFQMWNAPSIRVKPALAGPQAYANADLNT